MSTPILGRADELGQVLALVDDETPSARAPHPHAGRFSGRRRPTDGQPESDEEYLQSRRSAWQLLLAVRDRADDRAREDVTKQLARSLRVAYRSALADDVDRDLRDREWSPQERAELASGLRDVLQYENPDSELRVAIEALHDWLVGEDLTARLQILLRTSQWDLHADSETIHDTPPLLVEVADRLAEVGDDGIALALEVGSELDQQDTRYTLLRLVAQRLGAQRVGGPALERSEWPAIAASLSVADAAGEGEWADRVLNELAASAPERVPEMLIYVDLNERRVDLVLSLVEDGRAPGAALGRLLFGARIRSLDEVQTLRVLRAVASSDNIEPALGMLDQVARDERAAFGGDLRARRRARSSRDDRERGDDDRVLRSTTRRGSRSRTGRAHGGLWETRMTNRSGLVDELDRLLTNRVLEDPEAAAPRIFDLVRRGRTEGSFGLYTSGDLALLSRLAGATSAGSVWAELASWPDLGDSTRAPLGTGRALV